MTARFSIAPHFHVEGAWPDRLRVADGDEWRIPQDAELAGLIQEPEDTTPSFRLFSVPMHMRVRFWAMLGEEAETASGDFVRFSDDLAEFLAFKELPPPSDAVCELIVQDAAGTVTTADAWALVNFGEESVALAWPGLQLRLDPGEGCCMTENAPCDVIPPEADDLNALFVIRPPAA